MLKKYARITRCLGWCGKEFVSPNPTYVRLCGECKKRSANLAARRYSKFIDIEKKK